MAQKTLYLSYDGMTDPLGQSQVLPYLVGLSKLNYQITLISFEKPKEFELHKDKIYQLTQENGIDWKPLTYTKRPPVISTLWDIIKLKRLAFKLHNSNNFQLVHCRSYITSLVGLKLKRKKNVPFLFDMRGFWADERIDGGMWNAQKKITKYIYNYFKKKERLFFEESDQIVSLTNQGKSAISTWDLYTVPPEKINVIPCCVDITHFNYQKNTPEKKSFWREKLHIEENQYVLGYLGNFSSLYMFDDVLDVYKRFREKNANFKFVLITKEPEEILISYFKKNGITDFSQIAYTSLERHQVPEVISLFDTSIFFCKPTFSRKATSPTRMAELLACGVQIITNDKIGDCTEIIKPNDLGYILNDFSDSAKEQLSNSFNFDKKINKEHLRNSSIKYFNLEDGIKKYSRIYSELTS